MNVLEYQGHSARVELDPDQRIQHAICLVFQQFRATGSVRQTLLWFRQEQVPLPALPRTPGPPVMTWKLPVYHSILAMLTNPMYAGAYAFGKTEVRTRIVDGRARKTEGHRKPPSAWTVLLRDHHPAYIAWAQYERTQAIIAANTNMKSRMERNAARGGRGLLAGLLRLPILPVCYGSLRKDDLPQPYSGIQALDLRGDPH